MASEPKYENYSLLELLDSLKHIDKGSYPNRYNKIQEEIIKRKSEKENIVEKKSYLSTNNKWLISFLIISTLIGFVFIYNIFILLFNILLILPSYFYYKYKRNDELWLKILLGIIFIIIGGLFYFYPVHFDENTRIYGLPFMIGAIQSGADFPNPAFPVSVLFNTISWYLFSKIVLLIKIRI